jgi:hypothetical protein
MKSSKSVSIMLLTMLAIMLVVNVPSFVTNINGIYNSNASAQTGSGINQNITTFHAKGLIGTLVSHLISDDVIRSLEFGNSTNFVNSTFLPKSATHNALAGNISPRIYLAAGTWNIDVVDGKVKTLLANFTQITTTGINPHTHTITNYKPGNSSNPIVLNNNKVLKLDGYVDVLRNGHSVKNWVNVPVKIYLSKGNIVSIDLDPIKTHYHFGGVPIFGIVTTLTDQNNKDIRHMIMSSNNATNTS